MRLTRRHALLGGAALLTGLPVGAAAAYQQDDSTRLHRLIEESERDRQALDPLGTIRRGLPLAGDPFVDPLSSAYARAVTGQAETTAAGLADIDPAALGRVDRIAHAVLRYRTERTLEDARSGVAELQRRATLNASFGLHLDFPDYVATRAPLLRTWDDHALMLAQMEGFAGYLGSVMGQLREGLAEGEIQSRIVAGNVLRQIDATLAANAAQSPFFAPLRQPGGVPVGMENAYRETIERRILPGYRAWRELLSEDYLPRATEAPGRWAMRNGRQLYAADLARHTTTAVSASEIHSLGIQQVAELRDAMEHARGAIGFAGDLPALFEHVRTDRSFYYDRQDDLIAHFERIETRIWETMPDLFSRRPRAGFEVRPLPALSGQRGTGYYRAGPADGSAPGILYFNMAMLDTRPIPTLETLTLHEGIPGHHYQISLAQEDETLPPLLRYGSSTAFTEGWGLYAETLGRPLGLYADPYQWFGHLDMAMLRAVRLVVDTGLHDGEWSRQRAIDYMLANTSMAPRDVEVEIDRYIAQPGQACAYKMGEITIQRLRRQASDTLGARFDLRAFHDAVIDTGALPLAILEEKIADWIAAG